jgi:hypothetical protein
MQSPPAVPQKVALAPESAANQWRMSTTFLHKIQVQRTFCMSGVLLVMQE